MLCQNVHSLDQLIIVGVPALFQVGHKELEAAHSQLQHIFDLRNLFWRFEQATMQPKVQTRRAAASSMACSITENKS